MLPEDVKDLSQVLEVVYIILAVYQDVINVDNDAMIKERVEDVLTRAWNVAGALVNPKGITLY